MNLMCLGRPNIVSVLGFCMASCSYLCIIMLYVGFLEFIKLLFTLSSLAS